MALEGPLTYEHEPSRYPRFVVNAKEPFNAETPGEEIGRSVITPVHAFFVRNHGPVPVLQDPLAYRLAVEGLLPKAIQLSLREVKSLPKVTITATIQCAGNRRTEMSFKRKVKGVGWAFGALGNATWAGARLADVLELAGIPVGSSSTPQGGMHVEFISVDHCPEEEGGPYKASLPLGYLSQPSNDVLLAYEMNGEELTRDHGYPLRIIVPGVIGARSVKWISNVVVRATESEGFFMQRDYKMFPPTVDWHNIQWETRRPIMDFPIQSAISYPKDGDKLQPTAKVFIRGYAVAGGGRSVERVDVSVNGGKSWEEARRLRGSETDELKTWQWVLWEISAAVDPPCEVIVKAVDDAGNTQPESSDVIWNLRGVLNNSWHRIKLLPHAPHSHL